MKAIVYARVSTDDQADKGYSLPTQLEACRRYAEALGLNVVAEFKDEQSGAMPILDRPEGQKAVALLKRREADALIVHQVDRLSRDIVDLLANVRDWLRFGIIVHACDIGKIESELDIVLVIKGWQGSDERKKIAERTKRGKRGKALAGKVIGMGFSPYGYDFQYDVHGKVMGLVVNVREAEIVRLIFRWFVSVGAPDDPSTERGIAKRLSRMGMPTPSERHPNGRKSASGIWNPGSVHFILKNETYVGVWRFGKRGGMRGEIRNRIEETIQVSVPAIISPSLWQAAQERLAANKRNAPRHSKHPFLLRGLIRCNCGGAMFGAFDKRRGYFWYTCGLRIIRFRGIDPNQCREKSVRGDWLEYYVWDYLCSVILNVGNFEEELHKAQKAELETSAPKQEELDTLEGLINDSNDKAKRLASAWASAPEGIVKDSLYADIQQFERLYQKQVKRRDELKATLSKRQYTDEAIARAHQFRQDLLLGMDNATFEDKRRTLELLKVIVKVRNQQATVFWQLPSFGETQTYTIVLNSSKMNSIPRTCIFPCRHGSIPNRCPVSPNGCACSIRKN